MNTRILEAVHMIDSATDRIRDTALFLNMINLREALLVYSSTPDNAFLDRKWVSRCKALCEEITQRGVLTNSTATELLRLIPEPALRMDRPLPDEPEKLREMCIYQKDRIRFAGSLGQLREAILLSLPPEKQAEERSRSEEERKEMTRRLEDLVRLYRAGQMQQVTQNSRERLKELEEFMAGSRTPAEMIHEDTVTEAKREMLENKLAFRQKNPDNERINAEKICFSICKNQKAKEAETDDRQNEKQSQKPGIAEHD